MVKTDWARATTSLEEAIAGFFDCIGFGYDAWVEVQKNGQQTCPVVKKNPKLNDPFSWTFSYRVPRDEKKVRGDEVL